MKLKNTPNNKGSKKLFSNRYLEKMTRTHIAVPTSMFAIISATLIFHGIQNGLVSVWSVPVLFVAGLLTFTLVEYLMHRFIFHLIPQNEKQERFAYMVHGVHHDYPKDKDRLAMPPPLSLVLSFVFFLLFKLVMGNAVFAFLPGFLIGYALYLGVHYVVHAYRPPNNFLKALWINHGIHHYKDDDHAFGVSSPLWDYVFGTMPSKKRN